MRILRIVAALAALVVADLGLGAPAQADPFASVDCGGVRPGAQIESPTGSLYTMGFLFKGVKGSGRRKDVATYVSTVGNQVFTAEGTKVWATGKGPIAKTGEGKTFGRFVYAFHRENDADGTPNFGTFGLVRVDKKVKANPGMCYFGGPTGINNTNSASPALVEYVGQGANARDTFNARTALAYNTLSDDSVLTIALFDFFDTAGGDVGAPAVTTDGRALGIFDGAVGGGVPAGVGVGVARINPLLRAAETRLKTDLTLLTARYTGG